MTVRTITAGQPRPYADSVYRYHVLFEWVPYGKTEFEPRDYQESIVKIYLQAVKSWNDKSDRQWFEPKLNYMKKLGVGFWEFQVTEEYTD